MKREDLESTWSFLGEIRTEVETINGRLEEIENKQQVIIMQNLFVLEYLISDDAKRQELKERLSGLFDELEFVEELKSR